MKKIIFIIYMPLTKKFVKDFYFDEFGYNNIKVEYWDISSLFFEEINLPDQCTTSGTFKVFSYTELKNLIDKQDKSCTLFVPQVSYEWRVLRLFLLLSHRKCKLAYFSRGALPSPNNLEIKKNRFLASKGWFFRLVNYFKHAIPYFLKKFRIVSTYTYLFTAGEEGFKTVGYGCQIDKSNSYIVNVNSVDFDSFLEGEGNLSQNLISERYAVFLDEYLPYHPDFRMFNMQTVDAEQYFNSMNTFFDSLEQNYHLKIVIAAHPKSDYQNNPFNGRQILKYKTRELVKYSDFVISHMSTSISFAIIYEKPILFLVTDNYIKINNSLLYNYTKIFAQVTGAPIINANHYTQQEFKIDELDIDKYAEYKYRYLTSKESENRLSCQIVVETLCVS